VSIFYDPLVAKLIAWGRDRAEAIRRMRRALQEYTVLGVKTSIPFHRRMLDDPQFLSGQFHTQFVEGWLAKGMQQGSDTTAEIALIAGALYLHTRKPPVPASGGGASSAGSPWTWAARREAMRRR
jgi:acetyl/propionyl-CoA carboxylase alpha subunit